MSDVLILSRLSKFIPKGEDPWGCSPRLTLRSVSKASNKDIGVLGAGDHTTRPDDPEIPAYRRWHVARIRWILLNPEGLEDPISVDNVCDGGNVYPIPVIIDGWHRIYAHRFLGRKTIRANYGGRLDLLDYLTGKTDLVPEE
jgi:hypothetical protein